MKKKTWIILILMVLAISGYRLSAQQQDFPSAEFQKEVEKLMPETNVPAIGIGIIEEGELRFSKVYGELKDGTPAPDDAIFNIASLSKPITTLLTLQLVSNGDWDLDEPLYHYWVDPDVEDDLTHTTLTTRHVLTHTTGFDNWRRMHPSKTLTFNSEPGTVVGYSGEGFEYLRRAMERKFNKPFEELVDSIIFKPYGMNNSRLLWDEDVHKLVYAEEHNKEGEPYNLKKRVENACASDDVLTTVEDYCLFGVNVMRRTGLSEDVYKDMIRPQAIVRENGAFGLGWFIEQDFYENEYALTHTGSDAGVATKVILMPESQRGIVMLTNGDNGFEIIEKVESAFFASGNSTEE